MERQRNGACQSIELTTQLIITICLIQNMIILKLGIRFCDKTMLGELSEIVNPTLRERIDKLTVGKLITAKVNFGFGAPIKAKTKS